MLNPEDGFSRQVAPNFEHEGPTSTKKYIAGRGLYVLKEKNIHDGVFRIKKVGSHHAGESKVENRPSPTPRFFLSRSSAPFLK